MRDVSLRLLGVVVALAFFSLWRQLPVLIGGRGLLPCSEFFSAVGAALPDGSQRWVAAPSVFWWDASDGALSAFALVGVAAGLVLALGLAPHLCLLMAWALYLSFATACGPFLSFQWDNLLLESLFLSLFVAPWRWRLRDTAPPHPLAVALMLWLVVRLHVESAASKLLSGDPSWRDLTAMVAYYETAPLPTPLGWWAHQLPVWAHKAAALATFVVEFGVGLLVVMPRRVRAVGFLVVVGMHLSIQATANYGFFNILSVLACLFLLDDGHLAWIARRPPPLTIEPHRRRWTTALLAAVAVPVFALGTLPFLPWLGDLPGVGPAALDLARVSAPVSRAVAPFRSFNAYHLFASMTRYRDELVIEGSADGETWLEYELRYKPGDPGRAPPIVAPHQPRLDFQLWFALLPADLGLTPSFRYFTERLGRPGSAYVHALIERLLNDPEAVAGLLATNPFPDAPPAALRLSAWRYHFTDLETRQETGAWWTRELLHQTAPISR